jgi:hypothetical protein
MGNSPTMMKQPGKEKTKKSFHQPKLVAYGNIREITQAVGNKGNKDGGSGMTQKTQP